MKGLKKKTILLALALAVTLLGLLCFLFIYTSYDVSALKAQYPHVKVAGDSTVEVVVKKNKPTQWSRLNEISSHAKWAIVLSEDWAFYQHQGLDLEQMKVALSEMVEISRFRGASTISQQMVKNVFLSNSPLIWRKLNEIFLVQKVEDALSKDRILEIYLNCIEYGPRIYGIKAASLHYFGKPPSRLEPRESAFLAMLLPSPKKYYVSFKKRKLTDFAQIRLKAILKKMRMAKVISPDEYEYEISRRFEWETI